MPMTAFIGVRISWLIAARNVLFAAFAASAALAGLARDAYRRALSSAIERELREALQALDLGGLERALVGGVACHAERADGLGAREQRHAHQRADAAARERVRAALPGVVVVDHERRRPTATRGREPLAERHARPSSSSKTPVATRFSSSSPSELRM